MTVSSSPSSKPVIFAISLSLSSTCTLSIILDGRFLDATFGSSEKNSFPSTKTFLISFPLTVIFPSLSISTPGIFFNRSSSMEPSVSLYDSALNSIVSLRKVTSGAFPMTTASPSWMDASDRVSFPNCIGLFFPVTWMAL